MVTAIESAARNTSDQKSCSACELSQSQAEAVRKCKSTFFAAAMIPFASEKTLRLGCDWLGWVFIFDDCLDNGEIRNDPNRAKNFTESLLSILDDEGSEERRMYCGIDATNPIVRFHDGLWHFIRTNSSQGERWPSVIKIHRLKNIRHCKTLRRGYEAVLPWSPRTSAANGPF